MRALSGTAAAQGSMRVCPNCYRPVEARDFMNPAVVGFLDSVLPSIDCECGYYGLPITISMRDYRKLARKR